MRTAVTKAAAPTMTAVVSHRTGSLRGLYAVTPDLVDTARLVAMVDAAIAGGATAVQYRNKSGSPALRAEQAVALAALCRSRDAVLIVNDDAALARDVGAQGVHLGEDDGDLAAARALLGDACLIGVSCYDDFGRAERMVAAGADYIAFGSFYPSHVKPGARRAGVALLERARSLGVPVVAIGGIDASNTRSLVDAGADSVAVISAVFGHGELSAISRAAAAIAACFP
jgi:thiamine-phosphate pyrophosphorylase